MRRGGRGVLLAVLAATLIGTTAGAQEGDTSPVGHALGDPGAPVTVVEFADFACWACAQFWRTTWPRVRDELVETGRVAWRHVPFVFGFRHGDKATRAAECAGAQGAFWDMHDRIFSTQAEWMKQRRPDDLLKGLADGLTADPARFAACYDENRPKDRVRAANRAARDAGVRATPTFLVNGRPAVGALEFDAFLRVVEEAEREAGRRGGR